MFDRALERQNRREQQGLESRRCVVFLDEVGLPKHDKESLKIIHYYLVSELPLEAPKNGSALNLFLT